MASKEIKRPQISTTALPPRTLNVQKFVESRGSELDALRTIVSDRLNGDFRSHRSKRRRTTGFDNRVGKKRRTKRRINGVVGEDNEVNLKKKLPRHVRRKIELRRNLEVGFCVSGDGTKRLRTHVWYAKRFKMKKVWGFYLPLGLHGRGRGSRSIMKSLTDGVVVHDASYCSVVQLDGSEEKLLSILGTVLEPSVDDSEDISRKVLSGAACGSAMLHHAGAPCSHTIAPVTYVWRTHEQPKVNEMDKDDGFCNTETMDNPSAFRLVWIWIHAAAFKEGYDALEYACQRENEKAGPHVTCVSLEGQLGKLEVIGSKAPQLLQKTIHPVMSFSQNKMEMKKCLVDEARDEARLSIFDFENEDSTSSSVISLVINDPRIAMRKDEQRTSVGTQEGIIGSGSPPCLWNDEILNLWHVARGIDPPVEESVLCAEKHHQRMALYCLDDKSLGKLSGPAQEKCSRVCPVMLLKNNCPKNAIVRWSIILPLCWVNTFWIPLVSNGGRAIGLREKQWIACEVGLPYFPSDFPGCNAYSSFMASEAAASVQNTELHPPPVRSLSIPNSPPWDIVRYTFDKKIISGLDDDDIHSKNMHNLANNFHEDCYRAPCCDEGVSFDALVPRTSRVFAKFLSDINNCHLQLFPCAPDGKNCISKIMKDKDITFQTVDATFLLNNDYRSCFTRVRIHAYKDGVFEDGAVVCAPHLSDLAILTSRSDTDKFELQISPILLKSYFVQQPSGKWDLHQSSDSVVGESHRWPIGFVTTGFVYGSKKPVAGALCEAVLLARLREEQWNALPAKRRRKEIYVLVRNLRSTAYRLALAEIILEQQQHDLDYM